jgi:16S rRNA (cytosine1402-N4)-methyltransferase
MAHIPVLLRETIQGLSLGPGENVVDCTVGGGGHAAAILERTSPDGKLLGLDLDEAALDAARRELDRFGSRAMLVRENYRNVGRVLLSHSFGPVHAALLDLGFSSMEIDDPRRGFSFRADGPLDMRYDDRQELTAAEIVNGWSVDELSKVLWDYGEERFSRSIAKAMVDERRRGHIVGTLHLAGVIAGAVPGWYRKGKIHPATKTFQALRIAVNDELGNLKAALPDLLGTLVRGGRLAVISFHSLEDRIVKNVFAEAAAAGKGTAPKKPIVPPRAEAQENPRSRSAKLRIFIKNGQERP